MQTACVCMCGVGGDRCRGCGEGRHFIAHSFFYQNLVCECLLK